MKASVLFALKTMQESPTDGIGEKKKLKVEAQITKNNREKKGAQRETYD